jgi:biotin operon repressor
MYKKDRTRYATIGRILRQISEAEELSLLEKTMLEELKHCDSHFLLAQRLIKVLAGENFILTAKIAKAMDLSDLHLIDIVTCLRAGGLQIEGTAQKGYRFFA